MIKVVSFDVGNTLLKTSNGLGLYDFLKKEAKVNALTFAMAYRYHFLTNRISIDEFCTKTNSERKVVVDIVDGYVKEQKPEDVWDDVGEVLQQLKSAGIRMMVLSNKSFFNPYTMNTYGLDTFFEREIYSCDVGYAKPDRAIFEHAIGEIKCKENEVLHVGDSPDSDYKGAIRAGWNALLLDRTSENKAPEDVPKITVLSDIFQYLEGFKGR